MVLEWFPWWLNFVVGVPTESVTFYGHRRFSGCKNEILAHVMIRDRNSFEDLLYCRVRGLFVKPPTRQPATRDVDEHEMERAFLTLYCKEFLRQCGDLFLKFHKPILGIPVSTRRE